jgi:hypothetical protein
MVFSRLQAIYLEAIAEILIKKYSASNYSTV